MLYTHHSLIAPDCRRSELHFFEQQVTSSQHLSHFFLQANGLPQLTQIFSGRFDFVYFFSFSFSPLLLPPRPPRLPNSLVDNLLLGGCDNNDDGARKTYPPPDTTNAAADGHLIAGPPAKSKQHVMINLLLQNCFMVTIFLSFHISRCL